MTARRILTEARAMNGRARPAGLKRPKSDGRVHVHLRLDPDVLALLDCMTADMDGHRSRSEIVTNLITSASGMRT